MMECLENQVGIISCDGPTGAPYNLQQIGLSKKQLNELKDDTYATVDEWFVDMRRKAAKDIVADVMGNIEGGIRANTMLEDGVLGEYQENLETVSTNTYAGILMTLDDSREYLGYHIGRIGLFLAYTGDVDVKIINCLTGEEIKTVTVAAEAGKVVHVDVNLTIPNFRRKMSVAIIYDTTGKNSYKTTLTNEGCGHCGKGDNRYTSYASFQSIDSSAPFLTINNKQRKDTAGLTVDYSFTCDTENWLCMFATQFGLAMLYRTGFNLLSSSIHSGSQFSNQMVINQEDNVERKDGFEFQYGNQLKNVLNSVKFPKGACFECINGVHIRSVLPA